MCFFLFLFALSSLSASSDFEVCYFLPPPGWQCARPKNLSSHVEVGFVKKEKSNFHLSINLATEKLSEPVSLKEYVKAVKEVHLSQPRTRWQNLGKFLMEAGEGHLAEISCSSPLGPVKMLQAIYIRDRKAYILTAAALQKEFSRHQKEILRSLQSLKIGPAFAPLSNGGQKEKLQRLFTSLDSCSSEKEQEKYWKTLQKEVTAIDEMGPHWQFLVLKEGHTRIYGK